MKVETEKAMAWGRKNFVSRWVQGAFDLRRRCRPGRYLGIAPAASALPQTKIPPAIRKFLSAFGITWMLLGLLLMAHVPDASAQGKKLKVLTSFLPIYCFTVNVAGDLAEVENLLPAGADPHDFQFSPREVKKLAGADMIVVNGLQLEAWLDKLIHSAERPKIIVEAAAGLKSELIFGAFEKEGNYRSSETKEDGAIPNPHIWLDPKLAEHEVTNILEALIKADPANSEGYTRNARAYIAKLEELNGRLEAGLASAKAEPVITLHNAFPYFARRYDLKIVGVIEKVPDVEPSPRYLAALGRTIRTKKVKAIFTERQTSSRLAQMIGRDYNVSVAQLDTIETGEFKATAYEDAMYQNLRVLEESLK
ncbi:metal ABC transporter solute-binding protein, Zn/Mn family [Pedosphaera parvula]|uniref:Periplasmic solute binding protein n=1 Tax=Pedosphaera parvula (strain Ellin514) TaxID=320771 RepID=B9XR76_PEDPL|nr:zinc ABC transporter substrate-binding protein [Pedosphaera parvula]EEF57689.1 periplasmic solute binding protein [Pedosphaera parvula Ellin514]